MANIRLASSIPDTDTIHNLVKENLYEGKIIKNEQELFRLLQLLEPNQTVSGYQKTRLKKIVDAHLIYEKQKGNSIKIITIYDEPMELIDKRKDGKYVTFIEAVLLDYLLKQKDYTVDITYRSLFEKLGMVNNNYYNYEYRSTLKKKDISITNFESVNFFARSYSIIKAAVERALQILMNRSLIFYQKRVIISKIQKHGREIVQTVKEPATDNEIQIILDAEYRILKEMGAIDKSQIFWQGKSSVFYEKVNKILEEEQGWENYYDEFHIVLNDKKYLKPALTSTLLDLNRMTLNDNIVTSVNKDAENKKIRYDETFIKEVKQEWDEARSKNEYPEGVALCSSFESYLQMKKRNTYQYPDDYVQTQELLAKYFLSIVPENQKALLEYIKINDLNCNM